MSAYPLIVWVGVFAWMHQCGWARIGFWGMVAVFTWYLNWGIKI